MRETYGADGRMDRVLGAAYCAPYGTPLVPADVRVEEPTLQGTGGSEGRAAGRLLRLRARGSDGRDREHGLLVDDRGVGHPTVDGALLAGGVVGPVLGERIAPDAPDLEVLWVDQVLRTDAEARLRLRDENAAHAASWEGDGVDAVLERAERGVVGYGDEWASAEDLRADAGVPTWLREHTPHMTVPWELFRLDAESWLRARDREKEYVFLHEYACRDAQQQDDGPQVRYLAHAFDPRNRAPEAFQLADGTPFTAFIGVRTDGPDVVAYDADGVLPRELLEPHLVPLRALGAVPVDERAERDSWLAVGIADTPMLLLVPPGPSALRLHTDEDGALTVLQLADLVVTRDALLREERFRRRWGRFLDEGVELSPEEMDRAVWELHERLDREGEGPVTESGTASRVGRQDR
ncbi:hypothetical protein [Kocuria sp.]|uniref:hypothetical protein n=1 Tax=Kocuria sp. TaxID=1871328 RepID=UPI0026DB4C8C|nr:hypothetical protein [Kocuria sp.]MDO4918241.1 hypothetical protein [Kocuria sp.]